MTRSSGVNSPPVAAMSSVRQAVYAALRRVYELCVSLPDAPLKEFETKTASLPKTTEAERLIVQRIGQDIFRARLMDYWQGRCPLTGITDAALLRASHIIPWVDCENDAERLNFHNGLLLAALWDAAFDRTLVTFDDEGNPKFSPAETRRVRRGERDIHLSPTLFRLLELLMEKPGRVFSRAQLLDGVWGQYAEIDDRTVDVHVGRLREALSKVREHDPIRTVRSVGYAFDERFGKPKEPHFATPPK
jgi:DNA-binding winged helix-turn-helix (wHTH) protein